MSSIPTDLKYTATHEWVRVTTGVSAVEVGITDYAQLQLGTITSVDLPTVNENLSKNEVCGKVESSSETKDFRAPVEGTVDSVNTSLSSSPGSINSEPYRMWIMTYSMLDPDDIDDLLTPAEYAQLIGE